jgi:prepilin-type N-terminal cleavage/methylation domain-containing protein
MSAHVPGRRVPAPPRARGFTLIEVMVALTIMSLIMVALYTTLNTGLRTRDQLETQAQVTRLGPQILDMIEQDLRRLWLLNIEEDRVFKGESRTINGEPADSLAFLTTVDSTVTRRVDDREVSADVCETGYRLRANPKLPDVMELWRRQSFHVDDKPLEDGVYELLHDRIVSFQIRYIETVDKTAEKLTTWDTSERHALPALVDIELRLEAVPRTIADFGQADRASRTLHYHRVIPLQEHADLVMRIHHLPPAYVGGGPGAATGPGAEKDSDGDGENDDVDQDDDNDGLTDDVDDDDDGDGVLDVDEEDSGGIDGDDDGEGGGEDGTPGGSGDGDPSDDFSDALEDLLNGISGGGG